MTVGPAASHHVRNRVLKPGCFLFFFLKSLPFCALSSPLSATQPESMEQVETSHFQRLKQATKTYEPHFWQIKWASAKVLLSRQSLTCHSEEGGIRFIQLNCDSLISPNFSSYSSSLLLFLSFSPSFPGEVDLLLLRYAHQLQSPVLDR